MKKMYYCDLLQTDDICSENFYSFVNAAVQLYEEEHPTISEEEKEMIVLDFFPKGPRSMRKPKSSPSSSCLTEETNHKRRVVQKRKVSTNKAKRAEAVPLSWKGREMPERLINLMNNLRGEDLKLIFEKTLTKTDTESDQSRLLMPFNNLICNDFLAPVESRIVDGNVGVQSILFDQQSVKWDVIFKRRDMKKKSGKRSLNYVLISGWSNMVKANDLKEGDNISVWSFMCSALLCFAIAPPPTQ